MAKLTIDPNSITADRTLTAPDQTGTIVANGGSAPTDGQAVVWSAANSRWQPGSAGLSKFTEAESTAAPNGTIYADSLTAAGASTNADAVFAAKGTGANLAQVPNNLTTGGDKRGTYATDWQKKRSASGQVAGGSASTVGGGEQNTAASNYATVAGGFNNSAVWVSSFVGGGDTNNASGNAYATIVAGKTNTASAAYTFIGGGISNTASASGATVVGGGTNEATGSDSFVGGGGANKAWGQRSVVAGGYSNRATVLSASVGGGDTNTADGQYSTIPGGYYGTVRGLYGRFSYASGRRVADGDAQFGLQVLRKATTDATTTVLTSDAGAAATTNTALLPNNQAAVVRVWVVGRQYGGSSGTAGDTSAWRLECVVKRGANAAATALVGTVTSTLLGQDAAAAAWTATLVANTTTGAIDVSVAGEANKSVAWTATIELTEVG